jgi:hypothetical protein
LKPPCRQADTGLLGRCSDARAELGRVGVCGAVRGVVQVMEFCDRGEAGFQHFHVGERGNCFDLVRSERGKEAIHDLAPRPEITAALGEPRHAALERVAVQVGHAGQRDTGQAHRVVRGGGAGDAGDGAIGDGDADIVRPAGRQQRGGQEEG